MKKNGFCLISLLVVICIIAIMVVFGLYFNKGGYFKNYQTGKNVKENLIEEIEEIQNRETELLKKQMEEN